MDNGKGGDFASLIGGEGSENSLETSYTIAYGITVGNIYRFRFRSRNVNGWSEFSEIMYIRAATVPERPTAPTFLGATSSSISVQFSRSLSDGGALISVYELYINEGGISTTYSKVETYDGKSL